MTRPRRTLRLRDMGEPGPGRPAPLDLEGAARCWAPLDPARFLDMNPSLAVLPDGDRWVVFCRYPVPPVPGRGSVWAVRVDDRLQPCGPPQMLAEAGIDPRVMTDRSGLTVAFAVLEQEPATGRFTGCGMVLARFALRESVWTATEAFRLPKAPIDGRISADAQPGWEKNWLPFPLEGGGVGLVYSHEPWQVLVLDAASPPTFTAAHAAPGLAWDFGTVRGGTPPIPYEDGRLVTFFHASQVVGARSVYAVGACVLETEPPFAPVLQTAAPLYVAPYRRGAERFGWGFAGSVVFPGGALRTAEGYDLLCGLDDGEIAVLPVDAAALRERLGPIRPPAHAISRDGRGGAAALRLDPAILAPHDDDGFDEPIVNLARHLAGEGRVFADVGAGVGGFAVSLAAQFRRVLAFEPSAARHAWLTRNLALNGAANVAAFRTLPTRADGLDGRDLPDVDLVKLDAPGRERAVLDGAAETLRRSWPVVLARIASPRSDPSAVVAALTEAGYAVRSVTPSWLIGLPPRQHRPVGWLS